MSRLSNRTTTEDGDQTDLGPYRANQDGLPLKIWGLQQKLYAKAKREPLFRFYRRTKSMGKPDAGKLHVRFDEGPGRGKSLGRGYSTVSVRSPKKGGHERGLSSYFYFSCHFIFIHFHS